MAPDSSTAASSDPAAAPSCSDRSHTKGLLVNPPDHRPSVLFVCVKNGGKSQIAVALMRHLAGDAFEVYSAGTKPGDRLNNLSIQAVEELGASMAGEYPKPIDPAVLARVDRVIVTGGDARVDPLPAMRGQIEVWETDEPSERGIEGMERMRLVRDDLNQRVHVLAAALLEIDEVSQPAQE
jgi:arsenate-mycothiol transferase